MWKQWLIACGCWLLIWAASAAAQTSLPPRWEDLPMLAETWPLAWSTLVQEVAPGTGEFEKDVMQRVNALLDPKTATKETYRCAEAVLAATLRHHLSVRRSAPLTQGRWHAVQADLETQLASVRTDWLKQLRESGDHKLALKFAELWASAPVLDGPLRSAILALWIDQAEAAREQKDYAAARIWLERIDAAFPNATEAKESRQALHEHAMSLLKDTPHKTLVVAVRSLPELMSPATAWTNVEKQTLELIFDRLYHLEPPSALGKSYRPQAAAALPSGALNAAIPLRRDVYFGSGDRLTAADLLHTARLMNQTDALGRSGLWRDFLEIPRLEGNPFQIHVGYPKGLFDPHAPLTFRILPHQYRGKQLQRSDDPEFAKAPLGSGPFQYVGRQTEDGRTFAVFKANPYDPRLDSNPIREIRLTTWTDARKDLTKPLPHLIFDAPTDQLAALKELGYTENGVKNTGSVQILAVNQRKASLASVAVRKAIAHVIDRQALLERHFRSPTAKGKYHATVNGLFPRDSWANAPAPNVPEDMFHVEHARSAARKAKKELASMEWTLKFPAGDPRVKAACADMAQAVAAVFQDAEIKAEIKLQALPPHALRKALDDRDYDLLYTSVDRLDDPVRLALLFDRQDDAMKAGGSNFLGCTDDTLDDLVRSSLQYRRFTNVEETMQAIHMYMYKSMPAIPLWQLDVHVLVHSTTLRTPPLDPEAVFANVRAWKVVP